jgi:hypothetical protein
LTVLALIALTALSAVCASTALWARSAVSAWAALGTWPRLSSSISAPVIGPDCWAEPSLASTLACNRLAGIECIFTRLPGSDFTFTALPLILAFLAA